jgi:predicted transcriptional regulator
MPSSTTLKLPDSLKSRIAELARATGQSPHAFMVEAISAQTALAERRAAFLASAQAAEQEVGQYGLVYDADEVLSYMDAKLSGRKAVAPKAHKL